MYPRGSAQGSSSRQQPGRANLMQGGARIPTSYADLMEDDETTTINVPPPQQARGGIAPRTQGPPSIYGGSGARQTQISHAPPTSSTRRPSGGIVGPSNSDRRVNSTSTRGPTHSGPGVAIRNNVALSPGGRIRRSTEAERLYESERVPDDVDHDFYQANDDDPYLSMGGVGGGGAEPLTAKAVLDAYQALEEMPVGGRGGRGAPNGSTYTRGAPPLSTPNARHGNVHSSTNVNPVSGTGMKSRQPLSQESNVSAPIRPSSTSARGRGRTPSSSLAAGRGGLGLVRGGPPSPQTTVGILNNDHRTTAKGRVLQGAVDDMYDMYYGAGGEKDPTLRGNAMPSISSGRGSSGPVGRGRRYDDGETDERLLAKVTGRGGGVIGGETRMSRPVNMELVMNPQSWTKGPVDTEGRVFDASDRNLLCMDVQGNLAVVGSADHGLKVFDITTMREKRKLYGKTCGHTEWVTTVAFLKDGRILSGGMDSKLCLWHASALRCTDLLGHTGSISQVATNEQGIAISAGYDRSLRVWDCGAGGSEIGTMLGHNQPVTMFDWTGPMLLSGDRKGTVKVWDIETNKCAATHATQNGQIGSLGNLLIPQQNDHLSFVGDQGGVVSIFDFRRSGNNPIFAETLHPGGVVSGLKGMNTFEGGDDIGGLIVSCGADRQIHVLEPRMNFSPLHTFKEHKDFIYSLETFGGRFVLSGGGNGWLLVHDIKSGKCCYGLGANAAAVRNIFATNSHLVCAGDDGKATVYDF